MPVSKPKPPSLSLDGTVALKICFFRPGSSMKSDAKGLPVTFFWIMVICYSFYSGWKWNKVNKLWRKQDTLSWGVKRCRECFVTSRRSRDAQISSPWRKLGLLHAEWMTPTKLAMMNNWTNTLKIQKWLFVHLGFASKSQDILDIFLPLKTGYLSVTAYLLRFISRHVKWVTHNFSAFL